jgi:hypothetical protein
MNVSFRALMLVVLVTRYLLVALVFTRLSLSLSAYSSVCIEAYLCLCD